MKRVLAVLAATAFLLTIAGSALAQDKVTVCHAAGQDDTDKYVTLEVPATESGFPQGHFTEDGTAEAGHEDDYLGPCEVEETPSPSPEESPSEEPSESPSEEPSESPSEEPSESPSEEPTPTLACDDPDTFCLPPTDTVGSISDGAPVLPLVLLILGGVSLIGSTVALRKR